MKRELLLKYGIKKELVDIIIDNQNNQDENIKGLVSIVEYYIEYFCLKKTTFQEQEPELFRTWAWLTETLSVFDYHFKKNMFMEASKYIYDISPSVWENNKKLFIMVKHVLEDNLCDFFLKTK